MQIGNLTVDLALQSAQFVQGLKDAVTQTNAAAKSINAAIGLMKGAAVGLAGAISVDAIWTATKASFDYADAIQDLSDKTGASTKIIQEMRYAAQMTGSSFESADTAIGKFALKVGQAKNGSEAARKELAAYGVTSYNLDKATVQAADGIAKLGDKQRQTAATTDLFGKKAGDLTNLMSQGSAGFNDLAAKAQQLGVVLENDVISNAGQFNDQLDTMQMVMTAQLANVIIQNADALTSLATGFMNAAGAAVEFFQQMKIGRLMSTQQSNGALVDITAGFRMLGGESIDEIKKTDRDQLMRMKGGRQALWDQATARIHDPETTAEERKALEVERRKIAFHHRQARFQPSPAGFATSDKRLLPSAKPAKAKGKSAQELAAEEAERQAAFLADLSRTNDDLLSAKQALVSDIIEQSVIQRDLLTHEVERQKAAIEQDVIAKKLTRGEADQLLALEDKIAYEKSDLINRRENETLARQKLDIAKSGIGNELDLLSSAQSLSRTQSDRRAIGLRIVDLQYQQERLALDAIVASKESTDAERQIANARLGVLASLQNNDRAGVVQSTMGPGVSFLDAIPRTVDEITESLQAATVEGLGGFQSELLATIRGTGNLGDAFTGLVDTVLDGLMKIALQQAIIQPLGAALFGGGGGGGGGLLGSIGGSLAGALGIKGARANGGYTAPGTYLVGERGPELATFGEPSNVIPFERMRGMGGGRQVTINVDARGSNDPAAIRQAARAAVMEAMPMSMSMTSDYTMSRANRPKM